MLNCVPFDSNLAVVSPMQGDLNAKALNAKAQNSTATTETQNAIRTSRRSFHKTALDMESLEGLGCSRPFVRCLGNNLRRHLGVARLLPPFPHFLLAPVSINLRLLHRYGCPPPGLSEALPLQGYLTSPNQLL